METASIQLKTIVPPVRVNTASAKTALAGVRTLKIHPLIRVNRREDITVPEIRLSGAWLEKFGFHHGHRVEVKMTEGMLVLTPVTDPVKDHHTDS